MSVSHDHPRFSDPDYEPFQMREDYDSYNEDEYAEVLAERLRSEINAILAMMPSRRVTDGIE